MQETLYHVFTQRGYDRTLRNPPAQCKMGEYIVGVKIIIPDDVFQRRPIPIVEVALKSPHIGTADVIVDGEQMRTPADEAAFKQAKVQEQFARLFEMGRNSRDIDMRDIAEDALQQLLNAGVDVRIVSEEAAEEPMDSDG